MAAAEGIVKAIEALYLDRKDLAGSPGFEAASKVFDLVRRGRPEDYLGAWAFALVAEQYDRVKWGPVRALVAAWLLEVTGGTFTFPTL